MKITSILPIVLLSISLVGCVNHPQPAALATSPPMPPGWQPYTLSMAQRAALQVTTNWVDREVVRVVKETNVVVQFVTNQVERVVEKLVTVAGSNVVVMVTNQTDVVGSNLLAQVNTLLTTNMEHVAESIKVSASKLGTSVAGAAGMIPGWGQVVGGGILGILGLFAASAQKKLNASNDYANQQAGLAVHHQEVSSGLAQEVEAGIETMRLLASSDKGQQVIEKYKGWLQSHQKEQAIIGTVSTIVNENVDNDLAKFVANGLVGSVAAPVGAIPPIPQARPVI